MTESGWAGFNSWHEGALPDYQPAGNIWVDEMVVKFGPGRYERQADRMRPLEREKEGAIRVV